MVVEKFQIYSVNITANTFVSQKIESVHFYSSPKQNSPPGFYHYPPGRQELSIPPEQCFLKIFFPEEKVEVRIMELKKIPKLRKVLVTSLDKFHHLCNLCFFVQ